MSFTTNALVLKVTDSGESDRIVTLLTAEYGIIRAFANRAKRMNSKIQAATQTLCYGEFTVYTGRDSYVINSAESKEVFFGLRDDMAALSLGQYFCRLAMDLVPEGEPAPDSLRVILNSLSFLGSGRRAPGFVKAVTELKLISLAGYSPDILSCGECGENPPGNMYFDTRGGRLYCPQHRKGDMLITPGVLTAMRHIILNPIDRIYSFSLSPGDEAMLEAASEKFLLNQTGKTYTALEYYKTFSAEQKG